MKYQIQENCLTIYLPKEVDHCVTEDIRLETDRLIRVNHIRYVIFDFQDTVFMDSSGIGMMLGRFKMLSLIGGEIWAVHVNDRMRKIMKMSGATKLIQIEEENQ